MWTHPLGEGSGDFDVETIVDAREDFEGEDDGDYADYVEVGGDFGTLGLSFGEDDAMGRSFSRKFNKSITKVVPKAVTAPVKKLGFGRFAAKAVTAPIAITQKAIPRKIGGMKMGFMKKPLSKIQAKVETAIDHKKDMALQKITGSTASNSVSYATDKSEEAMIAPVSHTAKETVVSNGGQLSEQKLTKNAGVKMSRASWSHPLLDSGMGELPEGMGALSFSNLLSSVKTKAAEELAKLKAKTAADAKARLAQAAGNISANLFNKPEVQAAMAEQAKSATASTLAEKMLDPGFQKKAGMGLGIAAVLGAGLLYAALKNK